MSTSKQTPQRPSEPGRRVPMPPELLSAIDDEPATERDGLAEAWSVAGALRLEEPSDETFGRLGESLWAELEAASAPPMQAADRAARPARPRRRRWPVRTIAAVAAVALVVAIGIARWSQPVTFTAPYGATLAIELPDGSAVELNSGATLTLARAFGDGVRRVDLRGEGYFDVAHDAAQPFVVRTFNAEVTVVGTRFNVRAWPGEPAAATDVVLAEGRVRLTPAVAHGAGVTLAPGQAARVVDPTAPPAPPVAVDLVGALAWRDGVFVFPGTTPLGTILDEVARRFDVRIDVADPALRDDVLALRIGQPESAEAVLRDLSAAYESYDYRSVDGGFELFRADQTLPSRP